MTLGERLARLLTRRHFRKAARARHKKLYLAKGKRGFAIAAARDGRALRKLRKAIAAVKLAIRRNKLDWRQVDIRSTTLGRPHWGGAADFMGQYVAPFLARRFGLRKGSGKRTPRRNAEVGGSPSSDHLTTRTDTFARDFPTFDGEAAARALALSIGWTTWQPNSFATFEFEVDGVRLRIQILWGAAIDHDDHVHVGIELIG